MNALVMRRSQGVRNLDCETQRFIDSTWGPPDPPRERLIRERFALEELHHQESCPGLLTDVVERADVGVRQLRNRSRLTVEPLAELWIAGQAFVEDLDRDGAIEPRVSAFVHLAHPTFADLRGHFVDAEPRARGESQLRRLYGRGESAGGITPV